MCVRACWCDCLRAQLSLDESRLAASVRLNGNGTFVAEGLRWVRGAGVSTGGILRGRWNVYYSDSHGRDRFWMQVPTHAFSTHTGASDWMLLHFFLTRFSDKLA